MALTSPLQDGVTPGGYSTNQTQNSLTVGRGYSGTSNKAAREDHIHPINVNILFTPMPVGAVNPAAIGATAVAAGGGSPGRPGHSGFETTAYALANHVHSYMFADYMVSGNNRVAYKPLADGETLSACASYAVLSGTGVSRRELIYFNFTKASTRTAEGSCGIANFPARADHAHPVNAPTKSTEAAVASALAQSSYSASSNESTTNRIGTACAAGCSEKYARADHVHSIKFPTLNSGIYVAGKDGSTGHPTVSNSVITAWSTVSSGAGQLGTSPFAARLDHTHALNVDSTAPANIGTTASAGTATTYARRDHVHKLSTLTSAVQSNQSCWIVTNINDNGTNTVVSYYPGTIYLDGRVQITAGTQNTINLASARAIADLISRVGDLEDAVF